MIVETLFQQGLRPCWNKIESVEKPSASRMVFLPMKLYKHTSGEAAGMFIKLNRPFPAPKGREMVVEML